MAGTKDPKTMTVAVAGTGFLDKIISITGNFATGLLEMILVLFFMLMSGDTFLRRLVEILPSLKNKKQAINIFQQVESDISAYLATITIMNLFVGAATTVIMLVCGAQDPFLWGAVAFLFNYIPILGPIAAIITFAMVGLLSDETFWVALTPAGLYFIIHLIEGEIFTPMLLARRFTINPVLVILALIFWYWMWGIPGAILAMPMLAITKIICDHIENLKGFGHFIEG